MDSFQCVISRHQLNVEMYFRTSVQYALKTRSASKHELSTSRHAAIEAGYFQIELRVYASCNSPLLPYRVGIYSSGLVK